MARYTESVCRLCRREGTKLFLKGSRCYTQKCPSSGARRPPASTASAAARSASTAQLREKQKVRRTYGVLERQFRNYFIDAENRPGVTGENLLRSLELRLDNVVYRMGIAPSRAQARHFVAHGHVAVNGRPTNVSSYQLKPGDNGSRCETHRAREPFKMAKETLRSHQAPEWLTIDPRQPDRGHRGAAIPRPDAARSQRAARGRVLLEVTRIHDRTREPADRACRGSRHDAKYEAGPSQAGYGVTLGNALRRVLLSSLEGAAVTSIQIRDIYQEFSTIPGVKEDVTQIVLNVKKLRSSRTPPTPSSCA